MFLLSSCRSQYFDSQTAGREPLLVVTEFGDFQCPACSRFALLHWPEVQRIFGDSVVLQFRHWPQPYHPFARDAAVASICAEAQGRFQQMHDLLFARQSAIGHASFESFAKETGVRDLPKFAKCLRSLAPRAVIDRDSRAAVAIGAVGTPTLVVEGVPYRLRADVTWLPRLIDSLMEPKRDSLRNLARGEKRQGSQSP
jgi:protein-disulfide isomerase